MSLLFETIRIENGIPAHLEWHQRRMEKSGFHSGDLMIPVPEEMRKGTVRCNILYDDVIREIRFSPCERRIIRSLKLIEAEGVDYSRKYFDRSVLDNLFAQKDASDDILIVADGRITDSSRANVIFFDGNRWVTPSKPLLEGTCRARLLSEGKISEENITVGDLHRFSGCKLINAMNWPEEQEMIIDLII